MTTREAGAPDEPAAAMSPARRRVVQGFIGGLLGLLLLSNVSRKEKWPICNFPMFRQAVKKSNDITVRKAYLVQGGRESELPVFGGVLRSLPLDLVLRDAFRNQDLDSPGPRAFTQVLLREYEQVWIREGRPLPPPDAVRLYELDYHFTAGDWRPRLVRKTLLLEAADPGP